MEIKKPSARYHQYEYRVPIALGSIEIDWLVPAFLPPTLEKSKSFFVSFWNQAVTRHEKKMSTFVVV